MSLSKRLKKYVVRDRLRIRITLVAIAVILLSSIPISKFMLYNDFSAVVNRQYKAMDNKVLKIEDSIHRDLSINNVDPIFFQAIIHPGERVTVDERSTGKPDFVDSLPDVEDRLSRLERQVLAFYIPILFKSYPEHRDQELYNNQEFGKFSEPKMYIDEKNHLFAVTEYSFRIGNRIDTIQLRKNLTEEMTLPFDTFLDSLYFMVIWFLIMAVLGTLMFLRAVFKPLERVIKDAFGKEDNHKPFEKLEDPNYGREVSAIVEAFNSLLDKYHDLAQQNLNTMQDVSHEVKTHLTSIKQSVDVIKLYGKNDDNLVGAKLDAIDANIVRVTSIMTAILDLARLKQGVQPLKSKPYEAQYLTNHFLNYKRKNYPDIDIQTSYEVGDDQICIEREHFFLALNPIFENAVKYSTSCDKLKVAVRPGLNDETIQISITNYGSYIEPKDIPNVFNRYYRGGNAHNSKQGSGLGLTITREVADIYGGYVQVESDPSGVTTFMVDFLKKD